MTKQNKIIKRKENFDCNISKHSVGKPHQYVKHIGSSARSDAHPTYRASITFYYHVQIVQDYLCFVGKQLDFTKQIISKCISESVDELKPILRLLHCSAFNQ